MSHGTDEDIIFCHKPTITSKFSSTTTSLPSFPSFVRSITDRGERLFQLFVNYMFKSTKFDPLDDKEI